MSEKIQPMLAETGTKEDLKRSGWCFEPKIDGTRALCYKNDKRIKLLNRRGIWIERRYPELDIADNIKDKSAVLDGELVVLDKRGRPDFSRLAEREHLESKLKIELRAKLYPATLFLFDILNLGGKDLTRKPLLERKQILKKVVKETSRIKLIFWTRNGQAMWRAIRKLGLEGVMAKKADSPYLFKRSDLWLKIKVLQTLDTVVCGYTTGTGWRKGFGSLVVGAYHQGKLRFVGRVGTGFSQDLITWLLPRLRRLKTRTCPFKPKPELKLPEGRKVVWLKPRLVCEVRFMELTKGKIMRAPALLRLRNDKRPRECTL